MALEFVYGVHLQRTEENVDEVEALAALCEGRVGIEGVLDDLDRRARRRWPPALKTGLGLTWDRRDASTKTWWPQGVSSSADASESEEVAGRRVLAVSWYSKKVDGVSRGTRISFLDLDARRYRHALLVRPVVRDGRVDLEPLKAHAGGIVWCGPYLHVAATRKGIHTARLEDLVRVPEGLRAAEGDRIGRVGDRLATFGYDYLLPVRFSYAAFNDEGHEPMRYSFLSLDRSAATPELVAGEYGLGTQTTRLARYPLDPTTYHLATGEDGFSRPLLLEEKGERGMQGAAIVRGVWYVTSSRGPLWLGTLYAGTPGRFRRRVGAVPPGPEDVTYWPSTDTLWSVTEWPRLRWVFRVRRSRVS